MKPIKELSFKEILSHAVICVVALLCLFAAGMMLVLPPDSLKVDAVYQKF
jgi:hypothetical protein